MTLVKSLHSGGFTVNMRTCKCLMSWQLADALLMPCKCYLNYILVQFMSVHVCSWNTCTGGSHVASILHWQSLICRCSEQLLTSCSNGSFLKCSPSTAEVWVRFPAGTCQSQDLYFRMKMTLVKSLQYKEKKKIFLSNHPQITVAVTEHAVLSSLPYPSFCRMSNYITIKIPKHLSASLSNKTADGFRGIICASLQIHPRVLFSSGGELCVDSRISSYRNKRIFYFF